MKDSPDWAPGPGESIACSHSSGFDNGQAGSVALVQESTDWVLPGGSVTQAKGARPVLLTPALPVSQ